MHQYDLDVIVTRGSGIESRHRVHAAVVDQTGTLIGAARDPATVTMWRSCAKPFQVMPLIASGGFDELGWGDDELALACASHGGEPEHVAIAESMLRDLGLEEGDLACGPHEPLSPRGARIRSRIRRAPHAAPQQLLRQARRDARRARTSPAGPTEATRATTIPVQAGALEEVARWSGVPADRILRAVDGCGVVVFGLPLDAMARAYARSRPRSRAATRSQRASRARSGRVRSSSAAPIASTRWSSKKQRAE